MSDQQDDNPYGGDPYQTLPDADPVSLPYGGSPFGESAYGGSVVDNTIGGMVAHISEPAPSVVFEQLSNNIDFDVVDAEPQSSAEIEPIIIVDGEVWYAYAAHITDIQPESEGVLENPSLAGSVTEPDPAVSGSLAALLSPLSGAIQETDPLISFDLLSGAPPLSVSVTEAVPQSQSDMLLGGYPLSADIEAPNPSISININNIWLSAASIEPVPVSGANINNYAAMKFGAVEIAPRPAGTILSAPTLQASAIEPTPTVATDFDGIIGGVVEAKPASSGTVKTGGVIHGKAVEKKPLVNVSLDGDASLSVHAKEVRPEASSVMLPAGDMQAAITEARPKTSAAIKAGGAMLAAVTEQKPATSGRVIQDGSMSVEAVEAKPDTVIQIMNVLTVEVAEGDPTAWTLNTEIMAVAEYDAFRYQDLAYVDGKCYGIKPDGLYLLEGQDDAGTPFDSEFITGEDDADKDRMKRVPVIHADLTGDVEVLTQVDEQEYTAAFNGRAKFGRGMRGNRLAFGVRSVNGARFEVRSLEPVVEILKKRVA